MKLLIFRTLLIYLCVLFAMRLMGKRQLGELQPEELVSTILISNLASISIESEEVPVTASLIPLFLIAALELLGSALSFRSQKFFNLMSGRPKTVILDGQIDQNALRTLRLTTADLLEALRGKNIFDPRDVSYAVVETNGSLSAALRPEKDCRSSPPRRRRHPGDQRCFCRAVPPAGRQSSAGGCAARSGRFVRLR